MSAGLHLSLLLALLVALCGCRSEAPPAPAEPERSPPEPTRTASADPAARLMLPGDAPTDEGPAPLNRYVHERPATERVVRLDASGAALPAGALRRLGRTDLRHDATVRDLTFTPDGSTLVSAADDQRVEFWDATSGQRVRPPLEHPAPVLAVAIAPATPDVVITAAQDGVLRSFLLPAGDLVEVFEPALGPLRALAVSPDGTLAAVGGDAPGLRLIALHTTQAPADDAPVAETDTAPDDAPRDEPTDDDTRIAAPTADHAAPVHALAFSPNGGTLASLDQSGVLHLRSMPDGALRLRLTGVGSAGRHGLLWSADGTRLVVSGHTVHVLDPVSGEHVLDLAADRPVAQSDAAFAGPEADTLVSSHEHTLRRWDARTGAELGPPLETGSTGVIAALAASPRAPNTLAVAQGLAVVLLDLDTDHVLHGPHGHRAEVAAVATSAALTDPPHYATAARDGTVFLWHDAPEPALAIAHHAGLSALAVDPGGRFLVTAAPLDVPRIFRLPDGTPWHVLDAHPGTAHLALLDGGRLLALGALDTGLLALVDVASATTTHSLELDAPLVTLAAGPHTTRLAAATTAGQVHLIALDDQATPRTARRLDASDLGALRTIAFAPDGTQLATLSSAPGLRVDTIALWSLDDGSRLAERRLPATSAAARSLAFSPDGGLLVAGLDDGAVAVLETASLLLRLTLPAHHRPVGALAFVPGTDLLATGSDDTSVLIWDLAPLRTFIAPWQLHPAADEPGATP